MELMYWQAMAGLATVVAALCMIMVGIVAFADHATYRRGR